MVKKIELPNKFSYCPGCGMLMDGTLPTQEPQGLPNVGDLCICIYCGMILEFEEGYFVHKLSPEKIRDIRLKHPNLYNFLMRTREYIIEFAKGRNRYIEPKK